MTLAQSLEEAWNLSFDMRIKRAVEVKKLQSEG